MDESKVKQAAIEYLKSKYGYSHHAFDFNIGEEKWFFSTEGKGIYFDRLKAGDVTEHEELAANLLAGVLSYKSRRVKNSSWYPEEDPQPQAKLILDECGVKTYEVDGVPKEHENRAKMSDTERVEKIVISAKANINSDSGRVYTVIHKEGLPGDEAIKLYVEHDTAKQALESLGYEVVE